MRMHADNNVELTPIEPEFIELAAEVLGILSDPTRIRILAALEKEGELPVGEIASLVGKSPSGVSQHLARLRMSRLVTTRPEGTKVLYAVVDNHPMRVIREAVLLAEHAVETAGQVPKHHRG